MQPEKVKSLIETGLPGARVEVTGDGEHFDALVMSKEFEGKSLLACQRMVMATVREQIESGELHALSIKTRVAAD